MPDAESAARFLEILYNQHPNLNFTMELETDTTISSLGMQIKIKGNWLHTQVYRKPSDTGLLLHFQSQVFT